MPFATALLAVDNIIRVYEGDDANSNGRLIYSGIVGSLKRVSESGFEYVELRAIGFASMLSWAYYDNAGSYTTFTKNQDPKLTMQDIIDRFTLLYPGLISYSS